MVKRGLAVKANSAKKLNHWVKSRRQVAAGATLFGCWLAAS